MTPFRRYGKHSTGPSTYGPWVRTYSKLFSCKSVLTVCSYRAQSNEICTYGRVSHGSLPRIRTYDLLYLRTVECDLFRYNWNDWLITQSHIIGAFAVCLYVAWASCQIRKLRVAHAPEMPGTFSPPPGVRDPDMHHGTCVTHVPRCMPGSLTNGFL